jgi:hypothetical protein
MRRNRVLDAALGGLLLVGVVGAGFTLVTALQHRHATSTSSQASVQNTFWSIVSGHLQPGGSGPDIRLGNDLHTLLGPIGPDQTELPREILTFEGSSNAYGGVTAALGFDPFDETGQSCHDCGPLSHDMLRDLLLVKEGRDSTLLRSTDVVPGRSMRTFWLFWGGALALALLVLARNAVMERIGR